MVAWWATMLIIFFMMSSLMAAPKAELPSHRLAIDDGGSLVLPEITIAVVGNTRPAAGMLDKKRAIQGSAAADVIGDMMVVGMGSPMTMLVHLGDMVTTSSKSNWNRFSKQFASLIDGHTAPPSALQRIPVVPVVGDRDCVRQPSCEDFADVFPGFGPSIGFGRVATWQHFDLVVGDGERWRVIVLDSNKSGLGSRWQEQLTWLKTVVTQPGKGLLVFMHQSPLIRDNAAPDEGASELLALIQGVAPLLSIRAVISAGAANTQLFLPEGAFGTLHLVAGGGGSPAADLDRGIPGRASEPALDSSFERGLDRIISSYSALSDPPSQKQLDLAMGTGEFQGFARKMSGLVFPGHGWWQMGLRAGEISLEWRARQGDGLFADQGRWAWTQSTGWQSK